MVSGASGSKADSSPSSVDADKRLVMEKARGGRVQALLAGKKAGKVSQGGEGSKTVSEEKEWRRVSHRMTQPGG